MKAALGILALLVNFIGYVPYVRDILHGRARPHPITWGVWSILTTVAAINQVRNDGGYSSLFFMSTAVLVVLVFMLSLRYGMGGSSKVDRVCLALAMLLLIYWLIAQETRISTLLAVVIDTIAALPTLIKVYRHPDSETYTAWIMAGVAGLLTVLSVPRLDWVLIIYPAYIFVMNGMIVGTKWFVERRQQLENVQ